MCNFYIRVQLLMREALSATASLANLIISRIRESVIVE
ncbi:hypothetical protein KKC1_16970 [Calderihabitans maritimus]|uniref:Uncharacterized protein n=1 Tax=Calderihabitans maritimus TaxID=1246530 RepID=A0A1Z5HSN6_9FIRM|nr:hypothetical protein KKC1_16970 [Calderihabitans maritimus]